MTEKWLAELEALCEAATPGPWEWEGGVGDATFALVNGPDNVILLPESYCRHAVWINIDGMADKDLIAAARTAIPKLIAMVREAWADNAAMHKDVGSMLQDAQNENDELRQTVRHVRRFVDTVTGEKDYG